MSYTVTVQKLDCLKQLLYYISNSSLVLDTGFACDPLFNILHKGAPRDQLNHKEVLSFILIYIDDFHYIRMSSDLLKMLHCFYFSHKQLFELQTDFTLVFYRLFVNDLGGTWHVCHPMNRKVDRPIGPYS